MITKPYVEVTAAEQQAHQSKPTCNVIVHNTFLEFDPHVMISAGESSQILDEKRRD